MGTRRWPHQVVHKWPGGREARRKAPKGHKMEVRPAPGFEEIPDVRLLYELDGLVRRVNAVRRIEEGWSTASDDAVAG